MTSVAEQSVGSSVSREKIARLVARALGTTPEALDAGFRPATLADLPALLALRKRALGSKLTWDDARYVRWRYLPEGGERALATCWLCTRGDEVLGMLGAEPLWLQAGQQRHQAHSAMDLMVQPELDGSGLGVWINLTICVRLGTVLAIGSNANSKGVLARTFDPLPNRRTHVHPLHFGHFMSKRMSMRWGAGLAAAVSDAAMAVFRTVRLSLTSKRLTVEPVSELVVGSALERDVSALLLSARQLGRVEVERDTATLVHRLLANPRTRCEVWLAREGARAVGLIATRVMPIEDGRHALQVLDAVLTPDSQRPALRALLAHVMARGYRSGAEYISWTLYDPSLEAELKPLMFRHQPHPFETLFWVCSDDAFRQAVKARAGWSLSDIHKDRDSA